MTIEELRNHDRELWQRIRFASIHPGHHARLVSVDHLGLTNQVALVSPHSLKLPFFLGEWDALPHAFISRPVWTPPPVYEPPPPPPRSTKASRTAAILASLKL